MIEPPTPAAPHRPRPLVLCILDGFGERAEADGNAIRMAKTPHLDALKSGYPSTLIGTSGPDVGLPVGQMGNSEVGHLNFGAGRIAMMDISRIDVAVADHTLRSNPVISTVLSRASARPARLHLLGLVSDGGVHSSLQHLFALIDAARDAALEVVLHAFLDGRDTPPKSAWRYLEPLQQRLEGVGVIGTISGRYWAMDRDKRWDRVHRAWTAMVTGPAPRAETAYQALHSSYDAGKTDEFVEPVRIGDYQGVRGGYMSDFAAADKRWEWAGEEVALAFNFRPDRMREISAMLTHRNLPPEVEALLLDHGKPQVAFQDGDYACMTLYDEALRLPVAFPKDMVRESFPEVIARAGMTQLRCAETEKYAHVTYFFNGGREAPFTGEERKLVPSPRDVPTYDKKPAMSAAGVTDEVERAVRSGGFDFVLLNFANPDMVGHTGDLAAAIQAVEAVDVGIGRIVSAVKDAGGALIVTSDHGNCEQMKDEQGNPHTAHTLNPVPLLYMNDGDPGTALRPGGRICDVAPTMLELLGLPQPAEMTGHSLRLPAASSV
ncbi:MAG: 2,3-bisphosphoglycerate-independent phosphoglycerate mutase [Polyangiaceae bacterium]